MLGGSRDHLQKPQKVTPAPPRSAGRARPHTHLPPAHCGRPGPPGRPGADRVTAPSHQQLPRPAPRPPTVPAPSPPPPPPPPPPSRTQVCQSRRAGRRRCCRRGRMSLVPADRPPLAADHGGARRRQAERDIRCAGIGDRGQENRGGRVVRLTSGGHRREEPPSLCQSVCQSVCLGVGERVRVSVRVSGRVVRAGRR